MPVFVAGHGLELVLHRHIGGVRPGSREREVVEAPQQEVAPVAPGVPQGQRDARDDILRIDDVEDVVVDAGTACGIGAQCHVGRREGIDKDVAPVHGGEWGFGRRLVQLGAEQVRHCGSAAVPCQDDLRRGQVHTV